MSRNAIKIRHGIRLPLCLWQALEGLAVRRRTTVNALVREGAEALTMSAESKETA